MSTFAHRMPPTPPKKKNLLFLSSPRSLFFICCWKLCSAVETWIFWKYLWLGSQLCKEYLPAVPPSHCRKYRLLFQLLHKHTVKHSSARFTQETDVCSTQFCCGHLRCRGSEIRIFSEEKKAMIKIKDKSC